MSLHFGDRGGFSEGGGYKNKKKGFLKGRYEKNLQHFECIFYNLQVYVDY